MNPFKVLGLPETAALSSDLLKERFQELSREHHPDQSNSDASRFTEINQAYQQLASSGGRLKAFLQIRHAESFELKGTLPEGLLDLFTKIGSTLQDADAFLAKKSKATTMLAEALLTPELLATQQALSESGQIVEDHLTTAEAKLPEAEAYDLPQASALCRELLYLEKWRSQIQARFHELI